MRSHAESCLTFELCLCSVWPLDDRLEMQIDEQKKMPPTLAGEIGIWVGYLSPLPHRQRICVKYVTLSGPQWSKSKSCATILDYLFMYRINVNCMSCMCKYLFKTNLLCFTAPPTVRHWVNLPRQRLGNHVRHSVLLPCKPLPYLKVKTKLGSDRELDQHVKHNLITQLFQTLTSVVPMS